MGGYKGVMGGYGGVMGGYGGCKGGKRGVMRGYGGGEGGKTPPPLVYTRNIYNIYLNARTREESKGNLY